MTAPANTTVACGALPSASTISFSNGLSGGCLISGTSNPSTFSSTPDACGGAVTETWTATDACGRTVVSVSRTITVSPADLPTMTAPANISISCISQLPAPSTRLFSNNLSGGCLISGSSNVSTFTSAPACNGIITETWTATDNCDRALAQVSRTITLTRTGAPTIINCPANIIVNTGIGRTTCNQTATWTAPTAITSCGEVGNVSSSHNPGDTFTVGTTTVTYTFTDCASNTSTCSFTVTVIDNTKPVISTNGNKNGNNDANICGATVTVSATASDNCGVGTPSGVRSDNLALNAIYPVGITTIIWNVNDINGNAALAVNQTVTVTDNQVPTITTCPTNKTGVSTNFEGCTYKHSGTGWDAVAADNCAVTSIKYTLSGSSAIYTSLNAVVFNSGVTTVTAIAYDAAGNASAPCSFTVTVASTLSATITPTKKYVYFGAPGDQTATITASPLGGTAPYTVKIKMLTDTTAPVDPAAVRVDGKLICGFITTTGNEVWSSANANSATGITCATNTVTASSTLTSIPINGSYSVNVALLANAKFIATVTDAIGCSYTIPYEQAAYVVAEDARCFAGKSGNAKVKICHQTGNAKNPCTEICVDDSAVATHLAHGDFLGKCSSNCVNPATLTKPVVIGKQEIIAIADFDVKAYPNPSNHQFTIAVQGSSDEKVEVFVYDMLARMIKRIEKPNAQNVLLGEELPSGEYLLLIRQGSNQKAINVIKK
ncbi:HYR domain-containing protein [Flavobacterium sp. WC2430]|uniref:HYR domain-containing protein n=1 Tax=Flavobacterium sp. WC2430 TaxID=3234137 RepID=UPI003466F808